MKFVFMKNRDVQLIEHINRHYQELIEEVRQVGSFEDFIKGGVLTKAIKMDILQIAENINHLTEGVSSLLDPVAFHGIISIRNRIVHGYLTVDDEIIWKVIQNRLPKLIEDINNLHK